MENFWSKSLWPEEIVSKDFNNKKNYAEELSFLNLVREIFTTKVIRLLARRNQNHN